MSWYTIRGDVTEKEQDRIKNLDHEIKMFYYGKLKNKVGRGILCLMQ